MSALGKALLAFQKDSPTIQRDAINPHFKNKYVSLETLMGEVVPKLNAAGLVLIQLPTTIGDRPALRTVIQHADSGEQLSDVMFLMPGKDDPQGQGSAITYARRYALMSALGLVADEDDDGNAASRKSAPRSAAEGNGSAAELSTPPEDAKPSEYVVHFGKNRGVLLGSLTAAQLGWYATKWEVQDTPSDYDLRLKAAAVALHAGEDTPIGDPYLSERDKAIPFA